MDDRRTLLGVGAHEPKSDDAAGTPNEASPESPPPPPEPTDPRRALDAVVPRTKAPAETWSRHFVGISLRRAFRLHIRTDEVLPQERAILESQAAHITDPDQQAFLAWRRSVLLLVAIMFVPLTISRFFETFDLPQLPLSARLFVFLPALAEAAFCVVAFEQLRNWAQWRRILFIAWAAYFLAPFLVYLYPYRSVLSASTLGKLVENWSFTVGASQGQVRMVAGLTIGVAALLALGPKIISLMPGLIRASIVSKLLFPGTTAPGWLMMLAAPFYALFAYIIVLLPYQVTGSWEFVVGNLGIMGAQIFIGACGRRLTKPLTVDESHERIHRYWLAYIGILVVSAVFMVYGLTEFLRQLHYGPVRVITALLAFVSNVLLDTLIGTDAIVAAMAHFRRRGRPDAREEALMHEAETKLDVFVG